MIHIIFPDPDTFQSVLGSGSASVSYSNVSTKINSKGQFNNIPLVCLLILSWTLRKGKSVKMKKKYTFRYIIAFKQ
jgi:hypothetical protein